MSSSKGSGEHRLHLTLASQPAEVERGRKERHRKMQQLSDGDKQVERSKTELAESIDVLTTAIDLLIGKLQSVVRIAIIVLCLSLVSPLLVAFWVQGESDRVLSDLSRVIRAEGQEMRQDSQQVQLVSDERGGAVVQIQAKPGQRPQAPHLQSARTLEFRVDLESAELKDEPQTP